MSSEICVVSSWSVPVSSECGPMSYDNGAVSS